MRRVCASRAGWLLIGLDIFMFQTVVAMIGCYVLMFRSRQVRQQTLVIGRPDFTTTAPIEFGAPFRPCNTIPRSGATPQTLCIPGGLAIDFRGDLFIADAGNSRVLRFTQPIKGTQPVGGP